MNFFSFHSRIASNGPSCVSEWLLWVVLAPFALIYGFVGLLRSKCYDWHIFKVHKFDIPVISVGNIAVGGTGKTPVVDWLIKELLQRNKRLAVVSRGYGGNFSETVGVVAIGNGRILLGAVEAGDEPVLLAQRNPGAVVIVSRKRIDGINHAIKQLNVDIIILDDAFQHRSVYRDLDLVLLDAKRPFGNGLPLPAGLLREFKSAFSRANLILVTRKTEKKIDICAHAPIFTSRHLLSDIAVSLDGREASLAQLKQKRICAFAGIANPENFFSALRDMGVVLVQTVALPDHCCYESRDLVRLGEAAEDCDLWLTTEKDAVKLSAEMFSISCYQVPMKVDICEEEQFRSVILKSCGVEDESR
jgi:tetraacyldisaccharide 4'-kinase